MDEESQGDGGDIDARLRRQLDQIEAEAVPERLLVLAIELQELLRQRSLGPAPARGAGARAPES